MATLEVSALRAHDLPDADARKGSGGADPFVQFSLDGTGIVLARTKTIWNEPNPDWSDAPLELKLPETLTRGSTMVLRSDIMDEDKGANPDDPIGDHLHKLDPNGGFVEHAALTSRCAMATKLKLTRIRAHDVPDADGASRSGTSDPYVKFTLFVGELEVRSVRTETVMNSANPDWSNTKALELALPAGFLEVHEGDATASTLHGSHYRLRVVSPYARPP